MNDKARQIGGFLILLLVFRCLTENATHKNRHRATQKTVKGEGGSVSKRRHLRKRANFSVRRYVLTTNRTMGDQSLTLQKSISHQIVGNWDQILSCLTQKLMSRAKQTTKCRVKENWYAQLYTPISELRGRLACQSSRGHSTNGSLVSVESR